MRSVTKSDAVAPCPKCGNSETERIKFQTFAVSNVGAEAKSTIARRQSGSGPYDDFDAASIPDDDDSDLLYSSERIRSSGFRQRFPAQRP